VQKSQVQKSSQVQKPQVQKSQHLNLNMISLSEDKTSTQFKNDSPKSEMSTSSDKLKKKTRNDLNGARRADSFGSRPKILQNVNKGSVKNAEKERIQKENHR
jgi:hypothetical protein